MAVYTSLIIEEIYTLRIYIEYKINDLILNGFDNLYFTVLLNVN